MPSHYLLSDDVCSLRWCNRNRWECLSFCRNKIVLISSADTTLIPILPFLCSLMHSCLYIEKHRPNLCRLSTCRNTASASVRIDPALRITALRSCTHLSPNISAIRCSSLVVELRSGCFRSIESHVMSARLIVYRAAMLVAFLHWTTSTKPMRCRIY